MQQAHGAGVTSLDVYVQLVELRRQPSFQWGAFHANTDHSVYFHVRQALGFPGFLIAINLGPSPAALDLVWTAFVYKEARLLLRQPRVGRRSNFLNPIQPNPPNPTTLRPNPIQSI